MTQPASSSHRGAPSSSRSKKHTLRYCSPPNRRNNKQSPVSHQMFRRTQPAPKQAQSRSAPATMTLQQIRKEPDLKLFNPFHQFCTSRNWSFMICSEMQVATLELSVSDRVIFKSVFRDPSALEGETRSCCRRCRSGLWKWSEFSTQWALLQLNGRRLLGAFEPFEFTIRLASPWPAPTPRQGSSRVLRRLLWAYGWCRTPQRTAHVISTLL